MSLGIDELLLGLASVGTLAASLLHLRAKNSKVALEVAKDKAEKADAESLAAEVKRLRLKAVEDAAKIAGLRADKQNIARTLMSLEHAFARVLDQLPDQNMADALRKTNFGEFD